jgi:hypothetical protein
MTNDQLQHLKAVRDVLINAVELAEKGRDVTIEYRYRCTCGGWTLLNIEQCDYRCVTKPREVWVNTCCGELGEYVHASREEALAYSPRNSKPIRFVEAPDDEP